MEIFYQVENILFQKQTSTGPKDHKTWKAPCSCHASVVSEQNVLGLGFTVSPQKVHCVEGLGADGLWGSDWIMVTGRWDPSGGSRFPGV